MGYGQGSLKKDPRTGKWKARYWGSDGKQHCKTFAANETKKARDFLADQQADKHRGLWIDPRGGQTPFDEWALGWLRGKHRLGAVAKRRDESILRNHVIGQTEENEWGFGDRAIGRITALDVRGWVSDLVKAGYKPRTIQACHRIFSSVMRSAVTAKLIPDAPIGRHVVELPEIQRKRERFLSLPDSERLVAEMTPFFRPLVLTALYTGCRWQELAGLLRSNLDLENGQLHVRLVVEKGSLELKKPKSDDSRRTIGLNPKLVKVLKDHLEDEDTPQSEFVFTGAQGNRLQERNFAERHWLPAVTRASLLPLTFHDLRHTHTSWLIAWEWPEFKIVRRMGWKDGTMLYTVYGHLFRNYDDNLVEAFDQRWDEARAGNESAKILSLPA